MPENDILAPEDEGFFAWLSRPRRTLYNLARGEPGQAGLQAADFLLNVPDALLPGDLIPELSGPESDVELGDLAGMEDGIPKTLVDTAGGILDPINLVPIAGPLAKAARAARSAAPKVPIVGKALDTKLTQGRNFIADTMNWHDLTPEQRAAETLAKSRGSMARQAAEAEAKRISTGLDLTEREAIQDSIQNVTIDPVTNRASVLKNRVTGVMQGSQDNVLETLDSLMAHPAYINATPQRQAAMRQAAEDAVMLGQTEADEFLSGRRFNNATGKMESVSAGPYAQRIFDFEDTPNIVKPGSGASQSTMARKITSDVELANELNANPDLMKAYQRDLAGSLLTRAEQQGKIATRKTLGDLLHGSGFDVTNKAHRDSVLEKLDKMIEANGPDRDFAVRAKTLFTGDLKMNPLNELIAKFNANVFKPAATVGVIVPRVSFTVRNSISSVAQALSTPGGRGAVLRDPKFIYDRVVGGVLDPIDEAFKLAGGKRWLNDKTNEMLSLIDEAYAQSKGSVAKVQQFLANSKSPVAKDALEAIQQNVLDNPMKLDEVLQDLRPDAPWWKKAKSGVYDLPSKLNKHVEDRIRAGLFLAAKKSGQSPVAASATVRKSVLDYSIPTVENRVMRTWIPFGAFMSQSLPQSAKLLTENLVEGGVPGAIAGGLARGAAAQMFETDPENPIYPDMVGKMTVPMGEDEKGNPQYLTALGLPIEGLGDIPEGFEGREFERFWGVAANPLAKAATSFITGRDPFYGTPYGSYDKPTKVMELAGMEAGPAASTIRKILGTGIAQPAVHLMNLPEPWLDERQGPGLDAVRALTGARVRSVDEDMALRLQMEDALRQNPQIRQYTTYAQSSEDPETQDFIAEYREVQKRIREKRAAAKEAAAATVQ